MLLFLLQHSIKCVGGTECLHAIDFCYSILFSVSEGQNVYMVLISVAAFYSVCGRDRMFTCCRFFCSILFSLSEGQNVYMLLISVAAFYLVCQRDRMFTWC